MGVPLVFEDTLGISRRTSWLIWLSLVVGWAVSLWLGTTGVGGALIGTYCVSAVFCYVIATLHYALPISRTIRVGFVPWMTSAEDADRKWVVPYNALVYVGSCLGLSILVIGANHLAATLGTRVAVVTILLLGGLALPASALGASMRIVLATRAMTLGARQLFPWTLGISAVLLLAGTAGVWL
jgi:hypothetical protein